MNRKRRIFVASSSEAKNQDREIRTILEEEGIEPVSWRHTFHPGEFGLESLIRVSNEVIG